MRMITFTLLFAMLACLLPANRQEAAAETKTLQNPRTAADGTVTWDCVWFGHYLQSSDGSGGFKNEPIKWRVLSVDGSEVLLLADKALDARTYNDQYTSVTWETSTVRSWLNDNRTDGFLGKTFSSAEQGVIYKKSILNPDNLKYSTKGGNYAIKKEPTRRQTASDSNTIYHAHLCVRCSEHLGF